MERLKEAEEMASFYKAKWDDLGPRLEEAIKNVQCHRQTNMQLMHLTDSYFNFKQMAFKKYTQMTEIISSQRANERQLRV